MHHGRHCQLTLSATPPLLISRNEKKQIKQKVPRNGNFGWHSITPHLFRCHLTGLPWFPIYYRWPALQWRGLSGCLTVKLFHLFTICSLLFSPSFAPRFQPEYIFFSFFSIISLAGVWNRTRSPKSRPRPSPLTRNSSACEYAQWPLNVFICFLLTAI